MKIAINALCIGSGMTGIGTYTSELVECTSKFIENHDFIYLVPPNFQVKPNKNRYLVIDKPSYHWEQLQMPSELKYWGINLYHSPLFTCPIIDEFSHAITIHDLIPLIRPDLCSDEFLRFFEKSIGSSVRSASKVITTSEYSKQQILNKLDIDLANVKVIYQSISPNFFPRTIEEVKKVKQKYKLPKRYILYVGMIEKRKNIEFLCRVVSEIKSNSINLVIVGRKDDPNYPLEQIIGKLGIQDRVFILGYVPQKDLAPLYSGAQSFVFLSLYEGFGRPLIEAMSCGTPVISSNVSCLPEIGDNAAVYVNPQDFEAAKNAIEELCESQQKCDELISKGSQRAKIFTRENFAKQLNEFYDAWKER